MKRFEAVIFDLDGTLLDTLEDISDAANAVLRAHGFPVHPVGDYRYYVGDGVQTLMARILPEAQRDEETLRRCLAAMREEYPKHLNIKTRPYPGIPEVLAALKSHGKKMAVFSNKPDPLTRRCVLAYFGENTFDMVLGQHDALPKKPDPTGALKIANHWGIDPASILYLGDTDTDMRTAVAAGMQPVGALWGFRSKEELINAGARQVVGHPAELASVCGIDDL